MKSHPHPQGAAVSNEGLEAVPLQSPGRGGHYQWLKKGSEGCALRDLLNDSSQRTVLFRAR